MVKAPTFYFLFLPAFPPTLYQGKHHLNLLSIIPMNVLVLSLQENVSTNNIIVIYITKILPWLFTSFYNQREKRLICHVQKLQVHFNLYFFQLDFALNLIFMLFFW